jgi:NADH:ubiquinone oxidoreductase subunit 2 (subunit N)
MTTELIALAQAHAPLLVVVIPLAGAALAFVSPSARASWLIAAIAALGAAGLGLDLAWRSLIAGAPATLAREGVALSADGVGVFAVALITCASALALIGAGALLSDFNRRAAPLALALALCVGAGWTGALLARDLVGVFAAAETAWLASVALTATGAERERGALNGAFRMLAAGGAASALMLLGIGLIGRTAGAVELADIAAARIAGPGAASAGVAFVLIALALKAGAAPLHGWAGAAYGRAGGLTSIVLAAVGAAGALATLTRVAAHAIAAPEIGAGVSATLAALGAASVTIGSVQAVGAANLGRLAAYACAAQSGCILLSVALGSPAGFGAALVQLLALSAAAIAVLGGASAGRVQAISMLDGLGRRAPLAGAAITAGALSLMGAPLTIGFLGRWRLVEAGVGAGWWWAAGAVIVASLAGAFYGGRLIERLYFRRAAAAFAGDENVWRLALAPALAAAIAAIAWGLTPSLLLQASGTAADLPAGAAP